MLMVILFIIFCAVAFVSYSVAPSLYDRVSVVSDKRQQNLSTSMEQLMSRQEAKKNGPVFCFGSACLRGGVLCIFPAGNEVFWYYFRGCVRVCFSGDLYIVA